MWPRLIVGVLMCVVGGVWFGQGVGVVGGSFMTGEAFWAMVGVVAIVFGIALIRSGIRERRNRT